MSKTLIVMRHAKSSWDEPVEDKCRFLNERGRNGATALGDWMRRTALTPDEILCSSATRTQETADRLALDTPLTLNDALYMASSDVLMKHVQKARADMLLIVAHNPGIGEFAERLAKIAPNNPRFFNYPSGATTVFTCDIADWSALHFHQNTAAHFTTPHDLL
ncbi:MAG: histidine phosphatase family protein [Rhodobacteraceae bacterium]|jgi:phosphohistidine phosphatase|uniref:SixA phosphatase family protein n=1 Tax=Planktotalea sp. TaxID=2029877 RepID=UPI000183B8C0|nr:histidine phosphatase family protein [Planktotalea sp.]EDZ41108.1 phosphoglycerate mutase family protein [Rhodobacteraceae bacterium HTCC2083]MBT5821070.1 histidine phosphatase family protein [Paracoccaceae bacterium]MDG1084754.1 histidine phosphatase family protein [Planktotalea sp.]HCW84642.1 phosphoglycerate mutase [Paracoccaceae bacterium]